MKETLYFHMHVKYTHTLMCSKTLLFKAMFIWNNVLYQINPISRIYVKELWKWLHFLLWFYWLVKKNSHRLMLIHEFEFILMFEALVIISMCKNYLRSSFNLEVYSFCFLFNRGKLLSYESLTVADMESALCCELNSKLWFFAIL